MPGKKEQNKPQWGQRRLWLARISLLALIIVALGMGCGGQNAKKTAYFDLDIRPASGDINRLLNNAHYFKLMGRQDLALKELEEAYQREPHNLKVADALAQCYDSLGKWKRAQQIYEQALSKDPGNPILENNRCFSYYLAGKFQQAEECFRKTLARDPRNETARNNLGLVLCRQGRQEEARRLWRETQGEVAAQKKVSQALAALGMAVDTYHASQPAPLPKETSASGSKPPGQKIAAKALTPQPPRATLPREIPPPPAVTSAPVTPSPSPKPVAAKPAAQAPVMAKAAAPETLKAQPPAPREAAPPPPVVKAAVKPAAVPPPAQATKPSAARITAACQAGKPQKRPVLSVEELVNTAIEVRNGNGVPDQAHQVRTLLELDGFKVAAIANYIDFGWEHTTIFYRPEAEDVAWVLQDKFFQTAKMERSLKLKDRVDIKIILGHDLNKWQDTLARLIDSLGGEDDTS